MSSSEYFKSLGKLLNRSTIKFVLVITNIGFLCCSTTGIPLMYYSLKKNLFDTINHYKNLFANRDTVIDFESVVDGGTTTLCSPTKVGFTSSTLNCMFNVNHTPEVAMGFALKVESTEDDFTALLNISINSLEFKGTFKYNNHIFKI